MTLTNTKAEVIAQTFSFHAERDMETLQATLEGAYLCPNCLTLHSFREVYSRIPSGFSEVGQYAPCGLRVTVVMPWAEKVGA